jgi:arylsulfatase A-like enzyme
MVPTTTLLITALANSGYSAVAGRPNFVVILADDIGYGDISCYNAADVTTPNIDSIARSGVKFTEGYVTCPICGPSRAALLSGRYQQRFGFETNPSPEYRAWDEELGLSADIELLPELLKRGGGYATGCVGKWHLGNRPRFHPNQRGFDYFYGFIGGMHSYYMQHDFWYNWGNEIEENGTPVEQYDYLTEEFARRGVDFIRHHRAEPFFLYQAFNAPHGPTQALQKYLDRVGDGVSEKRRVYAAMLIALDDGVGLILDALREFGIEQNTLVFFLGDNGCHRSLKSSASPLNGAKGSIEEGGVREPFIAQWPGTIRSGIDLVGTTSSMDIYPTIAKLAGIEVTQTIDGVDLMPFMTGSTTNAPHEILYWRSFSRSGLRHGKWKLIRNNDTPCALYDLEVDMGEKQNLMTAQPERVHELETIYQKMNSEMASPAFDFPDREGYAEQRRLWENKIDFRKIPPAKRQVKKL